MPKRIICEDPRHDGQFGFCWLPCKECSRECDKRFQRPATVEEERQIEEWLATGKRVP